MHPKAKVIRRDQKKGALLFLGNIERFRDCGRKNCQLISSGIITEANELNLSLEVVSSLALEIWRLEKRLNKIKNIMGETFGNDSDSVFDQIQRIKDFFAKHEIELREHTGENYNDGLSLKAIHFETDKNMPKNTMKIIETVKPTVSLNGKIISHGEVVVAKSKEN